jgi:D-alanyl-lipoteichoic acid acyltransferase DltB (MBOAT superfamily)
MLFNSIEFVVFILIFIPLYFSTKGKVRLSLSLGSSYLFYGWWDYRFLGLIILLTLLNFYCGLNISSKTNSKRNYTYLSASIISSLVILGFFKYFNFFTENFIAILNVFGYEGVGSALNIILPVGVSFYAFQTMSYTLDVYHKLEPEKSLLNFATFVAFFPQLVAGPIVRASCFIPQLKTDRVFNVDDVVSGIQLIIWGFFLKVVIADSLSMVVDVRFASPEAHNALSILIGVVFYAFQIYGDFAGYSLIAIGIARLLGYKFPVNFNRPYFAHNFSDFWQRWHISLSSWLRDYLYIPLGGNRSGQLKMYRNLMITMLLGGLWHGASWNFIIWGGIHGTALILQRVWSDTIGIKKQSSSSNMLAVNSLKLLNIFFTFSIVCSAWVFFRSSSFEDSILIFQKIFQFDDYSFQGVTQKFHVMKGILLIGVLILIESMSFRVNFKNFKDQYASFSMLWSAGVLVFISLFGTFGNNSFIYFQF